MNKELKNSIENMKIFKSNDVMQKRRTYIFMKPLVMTDVCRHFKSKTEKTTYDQSKIYTN